MNFLTQQQRHVVDNFGNHCKKLVEYGFAYAAAHPNAQKVLDCEAGRVRMIEEQIRANPRKRECLDKMLRDANIQYMVKIIKMGMQYVKNNPECARLIQNVHMALHDYDDRVREQPKRHDHELQEVYEAIKKIHDQLQSIENRKNNLVRPKVEKHQAVKETGLWEKFKVEIDTNLQQKKDRLKLRQQINRAKKQRNLASTRQVEEAIKDDDDDDDESASEVIVNCEDYVTPPKVNPATPFRIGRVERHLVIPVHSENPKAVPKITPKVMFKKGNDGTMKFNVKLDFAERVMCNDKLVNSINIQNLLPHRDHRRY
jgi:hypothetical protein